MNPEEKAKSLVDRFRFLEFQENGKNYCEELTDGEAKQCALICVSEILNLIEYQDPEDTSYHYLGVKDYWQQVEKEIEKL